MSDSLSVVFLEGTSSEFWPAVMQIRKEVFVDEQQIDISLEFDDIDATAHHLLVLDDGRPAGVCRYFKTEEGYKMGRFAVTKSFRGQGIGNALIQASLSEIEEIAPEGTRVYLHAQKTVTGFYEEEGFVIKGGEFMEDGIIHVLMEQTL
ncbi:GNAT family N-acetyltransferase [Flammeovirga yaeyamensis]|uniref:GNAT family N-acetyltransferase n=1 Tax=Flammeovirga yaeyamensis TaxID=367791 RepID=A0AAX1N0H8_9BACT|nr:MULTISPECIES: GNAT family N-acetyltransferase [Flammeovirga]ANQ47614.1 GNAT family N-acetyltransferase [Flammeovirga sp. MY04]MBB3698657.1 putative GNAT family N-acyltransferase [Flammeovirga yaeyamensis]NMF33998.1 GNAT family N-acetyltransferase [Flammeovirga yaeyamensis]QWG00987.1 GNAT family N-acetyltransferase [Flammeovirga yaeyamensis]